MTTCVHPTALIEPGAKLGAGVEVGPFCVVGPEAVLEDGVRLVSHVVVDGRTRIGEAAVLYPFVTAGLAPQDLKYKGEPTLCEIGARTQVREHCTIHRGTVTGTGTTRVGADCLLMAVVHVAHDCDDRRRRRDRQQRRDGRARRDRRGRGDRGCRGHPPVRPHRARRDGRGRVGGGERRHPVRQRARQSGAACRAERDRAEAARRGPGRAAPAARGGAPPVRPGDTRRLRTTGSRTRGRAGATIRSSPRSWTSPRRRAAAA